jgi:hypothetical protein
MLQGGLKIKEGERIKCLLSLPKAKENRLRFGLIALNKLDPVV